MKSWATNSWEHCNSIPRATPCISLAKDSLIEVYDNRQSQNALRDPIVTMIIRESTVDDAQEMKNLHERSVLELCSADYSPEQLEEWVNSSPLEKDPQTPLSYTIDPLSQK